MNNEPETLGELVRAKREGLGWKQPDLAKWVNKAAKDHHLHLQASNGANVVEVDNVWVSRLEKDKFKRPLPESTLRAIYLALQDSDKASLYEALNRQISNLNQARAGRKFSGASARWPLFERLPSDLKEVVEKPFGLQRLPNCISAEAYLDYIGARMENAKGHRALMCAYMSAFSAAANQMALADRVINLVKEGMTVVYCSIYPAEVVRPTDYWNAALRWKIEQIRRSQADAIKWYSMNAPKPDRKNAHTGAVLFMELADARVACPPAVLESRDVLVLFGGDRLDDPSRYLWTEIINANSHFVASDEAEVHALVIDAGNTDSPASGEDPWISVRARVGLFKEIIEHWEDKKKWPNPAEEAVRFGLWKMTKA
jgi:hypothetical protein